MPHERGRSGLLSDSCSVLLDKRRALTITPGLTRDSCQTEGPYRIPRRPPAVENECVSAEMSKDRRRSNPKVHWTQLASNGTSSQSAPRSQRSGQDEEHAVLNEIDRRQIKIVLEDVLKTEIGQSLRRSSGWSVQLTAQSVCRRSERRKEQISSTELKVKRGISVTQRTETDSPEPNAASPSDSQSESSAPPNGDESSPSIEIKTTRSKRSNSETLRRSSEVSNDSCSQRESDSLQPEQLSDQLSNQTKHHEGSPEDEEQDSSGCESTESGEHYSLKRSPSSLTAARCSIGKVKVGIEHQADKRRNGEVLPEVGGARGSVLRLSVGAQTEIRFADEETPLKRCRLDSLLGEQVSNSDSAFRSTERRSFKRQSSESLPPEPIVLSSEEEEEREEREGEEFAIINVQTLEGAEDMQSEVDGSTIEIEQEKTPEPHSHITEIDNTQGSAMIEFQLSSVHMGGVNVTSGGVVKITIDTIIISLKDEVEIAVDMSNVCKYSVWEGTALRGCGLVKDDETPPLSLLLLWVTDDQACCLHNDLSVIQPETCPAVDSTCVVLCLAEPVDSLRSTMLASLMELGTSNQGSPDLLSPLSYSDSLTLLQSTQETHLLQLLTPTPDPCSDSAAQATVSAIKSQDSDLQPKPVYTLCHRRAQGSYSISMVPTPGAQWTPYRHRGPARRLIQFPPPPSKGAITVTTEDLECLDSGEFLNDVIIDFYLKYLMEEKAPRTSVHRSHVFSSFFYKQLTRRDNANEDSTSTPAQVRRHQRVKTWTRHVDIFDKDFLFVPVNQEAHWYLVVICFPGLKEPQYVSRDGSLEETENQLEGDNRSSDNEEKDPDDSRANPSPSARPPDCIETTCNRQTVCKRPCILIMDSLKLSVHERIFKLLREYLQAEWEVKRSGHRDFSVDCMVGSHCKVPLQDNSSDCGLYLLQYAESFLQDPVVHFDLPLRLEHWFPRQQVRGKREEIRDLILHLYRFQHGSLGNEVLETDDGNVIQLNI